MWSTRSGQRKPVGSRGCRALVAAMVLDVLPRVCP